jgi:hypothetical protein
VLAALAYDRAAREHKVGFALCNFPPVKPCLTSAPACYNRALEAVA